MRLDVSYALVEIARGDTSHASEHPNSTYPIDVVNNKWMLVWVVIRQWHRQVKMP